LDIVKHQRDLNHPEKVIENPEEGIEELIAFFAGERAYRKYLGSIDKLLSAHGFAQRADFKVFLENSEEREITELLKMLYDKNITVSERHLGNTQDVM